MGAGVCWPIISFTFVVATGVTVIISVFSLPAGFGNIWSNNIITQDASAPPCMLDPVPLHKHLMRRSTLSFAGLRHGAEEDEQAAHRSPFKQTQVTFHPKVIRGLPRRCSG